MASPEDHKYIATVLIPQLLDRFNAWGREYQQPRDLGVLGEFVGLYRKSRKLKTLLWDRRDGDPPPEQAGWREGPREIMMEVVAHGLLMLVDWDRTHPGETSLALDDANPILAAIKDYGTSLKDLEEASTISPEEDEYTHCGPRCKPERGHSYGNRCCRKHIPPRDRAEDDQFTEEDDDEYCPTCSSYQKAVRPVISHGTRCDDEWHQVDVAERQGGV